MTSLTEPDSNALLQLAGRVAHLGGWSVDLRARQVHWSDEVGRIHETPPGWQPSVDEGIAFYAPEHRALIDESFSRCAELGEPYDLELQILTARGRRVWVRTAGQAERDAGGRIVRVYGAFHDIDARKRAELALARMNRLYALQGGIAEAIVAEPGDAQALLQRVCQIAVERGGFALAWLARRTDEGRSTPLCAAGDDAGWFELLRERAADPAFDHWPLADAIGEGRFIAIEDTRTDPRLDSWTEPLLARGWHTAAAVPLSVGGENRLGLVLLGADPQSFGGDEVQLLAAIGQTLSHALQAISQRARRDAAEAVLRRSEAELRSAQRVAGLGGWSLDPQQSRLRLSAAAMAALGMAAEPFEGPPQDFLSWVHPQDHDRIRQAMKAAAGGRTPTFDAEFRVLREDGGMSWVHGRGEPTPHPGGGTLWVGSVLDVSAHKQAELKLREQVARLGLLDRITRAIGERLELDSVLRIVATQVEAHLPAELCAVLVRDAAQPARLRLGAAGGSAVAAARAALAALTAAPGGAPAPALADAPLAVPELADTREPLLQHLAGFGLGSAVLLPLDRPGAPLGMMLVARAALRGFSARDVEFLQQLVGHVAIAAHQAGLHGDLRRAYEELERTQAARLQQERLAALGAMAGGAAHDINNALSPAALYVESLLAREPGLSARARQQLGAVQRAIDDVAQTVERMRDFSRRGQADARPGVDLAAVLRAVAAHANERWGEARRPRGTEIAIRIDAGDTPLPVQGVEAELTEALAELVANAVDAMPGGGTLTLRAGPGDRGGALLAGPDNAPAGEPLPAQALREAIAHGEPTTLADGVDGARGWHAMQPVAAGQARLWVVASAPPQQLREPVMRRMAWQAGGLALVLIAAGAMAWTVGTRWVSEPAERLRQRIRQRMSGDAVPADAPAPRRSREIDEIDAAFRALDETLAQRERRLQAQLHRLHLLHRITHAAGARLDAASIEAVVVDHVEQHLPADACAFATVDKDAGALVLGTCGPLAAAALPAAGLARGTALAVGSNGLSHCLQGELVCDNDLGRRDAPLARQLVAAGFGSLALAPLPSADDGVAGVLLAARRGTPLQSGDCEFLAQLARHVALATHHAALFARLQHAYDELRGTQQRMLEQERLRAIGQMASGIAHDINNALAPALLHADALLERDSALGESVRSRLDAVRQGIMAVASTVARMRELYRPGAGDAFAPLDANELLRHIAELTRARWHDQAQRDGVDIELRLDLADALPPLPAVRTELRDALVNLVFNAVDAMPGGGTLTLASARAELPDGRAAVGLSVQDSGAGMDEATRARCLDPFFSSKGERGSGLGLPMVALAAQRHRGQLDIDSTPGQGSRFTLRLPLQQPAPAPAPFPTALPESARPAPLRLLVVDDDAAVREAIATQLRLDGHEVVEAASGRQALALLRAALGRGRPPHAVLSDMGMPDLDGRELARAVKALAPSLPVLMITGWGRGLADDALPAGVDMLLAKPLRLHELRAALLRASPPPPAPPPPE